VWEPSWDASVGVSWPIADGGRVRAEMAEAAAAARALEARLAEFDGILDVEIRQRVNDLAATRAAIGAAEAGVRAATEARRVAADRFAAGVATNTDVLVAQGALLQAALDRTEALASARLAEARLMRALGR
jgi:outer membrane protein TolC